jgi:hypothetical protein
MISDIELTPQQWEALKAVGSPLPLRRPIDPSVLAQLIATELAHHDRGRAVLTGKGRRVVVRGSPRLWDLGG